VLGLIVRARGLNAFTDGARHIDTLHLRAGLALWDCATCSADWALGQASAGPLAEHISRAPVAAGHEGLTRTQIHDALGRNQPGASIDTALAALTASGLARSRTKTATGGRAAHLWGAVVPIACS